jgi:hypothetical protein
VQEQPSSDVSGEVAPDEALLAVQNDISAAREELRGVAEGIRAALAADDALRGETSE